MSVPQKGHQAQAPSPLSSQLRSSLRAHQASHHSHTIFGSTFYYTPHEHTHMPISTELISLPSEILIAILIDLDYRDILRCREVCTRFKSLIDEDVRAQYKIELAIVGMEDGPPSTRTTAERLSILRARQKAWKKFTWTTKENVPMHTGGVWELSSNILAQSEGNRTLHLKQIPSAIRGIEGTEWVIPDVGCDITDISMDPTQDLLIIIEHLENDWQLTCRVHLHLRALSTGEPHPAGPSTAVLTHSPEPGGYSYTVQISESFLGVLMSNQEYGDPSELLIWNWKSGKLHLHLVDPELHSWAFLTPHSLLLAHGGTTFYVPHLVVINLESPQPSNPVSVSDADFVCAFHYPPLDENFNVLDMLIRSDPVAVSRPNPVLGVPFSVSREDRLFVITLWLSEYDEETVVLSFVPASTLLHALATLAPGETCREFEWEVWGPCGSRLMEAPSSYTTMETRYAYGMAFATVDRDLDGESERPHKFKFVVVRDFNQLAIRHRAGTAAGARDGEPEQIRERIVAEASVFEPSRVFKGEVVTTLPYMERIFMPFQSMPMTEDGEFDQVMLTEDALLLVAGTWQSPLQYCILSF